LDLTFDTSVLVSGSDKTSPSYSDCLLLLREFEVKLELSLVLDSEHLIEGEYRSKLAKPTYSHAWLEKVLKRNRFVEYDRARIPKPVRNRLIDDCHMHPRDLSLFVRSALASISKVLVAHDDDFWTRTRHCLSHDLGIRVESSRSLHPRVCEGDRVTCLSNIGLSGRM
jgi:hypothetical protein